MTKSIGTLLKRLGYQGAFGVDALIAELPERGLVIYPVVEVNPRYTMGRVALSLRQQLDPRGRHDARLKIYPPRAPRAQLLSRLRDDPAVWGARGVWSGGILGVTDWWRELEIDRESQETLRYGSGPVALVEALSR